MKIFQNVMNNPSQTEKYGNLNLNKITNKLSNCKPVLQLLLLSGFEAKENNTRLIWTNTNENISILKHVQNTIQSMIDTDPTTSNDTSNQHIQTINQQAPQDISQIISNLILNKSQVTAFKFLFGIIIHK